MRRFGLLLVFLLNGLFVSGQVFEVDTIQYKGEIDKRINLVILSDGYQQNELSKFEVDAGNFAKALFSESPYSEYQNYFNVFIVKVPSNESGASHPGTAGDVDEPNHPVQTVDNFFGSSFDQYNIHRLLVPTKMSAVSNVLAYNFPSYDHVVVLVNSPYYGGSGGWLATASLHEASTEVAIHELGHSMVGLKDEYYAGDQYAMEGINMTQETNPSNVKWKNWNDKEGIGIYQHCCGGNSSQWYRPHENCKMRYLGASFCVVCKEGTVERIHSLVSPIDTFFPVETAIEAAEFPLKFELGLIKSNPNTLNVNWVLNGKEFKKNVDNIVLNAKDLKPGENTLTVRVRDTTQMVRDDHHKEDHAYSISWTIENVVLSANANASGLLLSQGTLSPAFVPGKTKYTATVPHGTSSITLTPTVEDSKATVKVNEEKVASGSSSSAIPLIVGSNAISVVVSAEDGKTTKTYTIEITRQKSSNANASGLVLSHGVLSPSFAPGTTSYTATVEHEISSITITPSLEDKAAGLKINGESGESGSPSSAIPLNVGSNTVSVVVSAPDGTTNTYTIEVVRKEEPKSKPEISFQNETRPYSTGSFPLAAKSNSSGKISYEIAEELTDAYPGDVSLSGTRNGTLRVVKAGKVRLRAMVAEGDKHLAGSAEMDLTIHKAAAVVDIVELDQLFNGKPRPVVVKTNPEELEVEVLYNGSATVPHLPGQYEVKAVIRDDNYSGEATAILNISSTNSNASGLVLSQGTLSPAFAPGTTKYTASVPHETSSITLTPTVENSKATVKVNEKEVASGSASSAIPLIVGRNTISVVVTAEDGRTGKTYTIEVTRQKSSNANASGILLSHGILSPSFAPGITNYSAAVEHETSFIILTPFLEHEAAEVEVNGESLVSDSPSSAIPLEVGINTISVVVSAQDGTTKTYTILVDREESSNANAASLVLSSGNLKPAFSPATTNYTASVGYDVTYLTLTPTLKHDAASVNINGEPVASGATSSAIPLVVGGNMISMVVTAQDGRTKTYTIEVVRRDAPKVIPEITFQDESRTYSRTGFNLAANSNSAGDISYEIVEELTDGYPGDITLSGPGNRKVSVVKAGRVKLRAWVAEDDQYLANSTEMDLDISKAPATISIAELNHNFDGEPKPVVVTTEPEGLVVEVLYNGSTAVPNAAGEHDVKAVVVDDNYEGVAGATLIISIPTSVSNHKLAREMKLYPNPTTGKTKLELKGGTQAQVRVRDLAGRLISQGSATGSYEIDLENYSAGIYLIEVHPKGESTVTFKLQKQ